MSISQRILWRVISVLVAALVILSLSTSDAKTKQKVAKLSKVIKYKIAVIDTGYNGFIGSKSTTEKLCEKGHFDFTTNIKGVGFDTFGHGSHVANLIEKQAKGTDYCYLIYKIIGQIPSGRLALAKAVRYAIKQGATHINMSVYTRDYDKYTLNVFKWAVRQRARLFLAAGNDNQNTNTFCNTYPVCFKLKDPKDSLVVVGALDKFGYKTSYSNYGIQIDAYELGDYEFIGRGTSFASPTALGKEINLLRNGK